MPKGPTIEPELLADFSSETGFLIGVSGGRDSMALLHLVKSAGFENVVVCHVHHGMRGAEADADAALVHKTAEDFGYAFESRNVDLSEAKESFETAARDVRRAFFAEVGERHGLHEVMLAHHADDQVETVLINLFRGSGMRGLGGIRRSNAQEIAGLKLIFHRPLLDVWREEIDRYCDKNGVEYRDDASNSKPEFALRNRVRHQLVPNLAEIFDRDVRGAITRLARVMTVEEDARSEQTEAVFELLKNEDGGLDSKILGQLKAADQFRVVSRWLDEMRVPDCGFREVERVLSLLSETGNPAKINLPGDVHARRKAGRIFLELAQSSSDENRST